MTHTYLTGAGSYFPTVDFLGKGGASTPDQITVNVD